MTGDFGENHRGRCRSHSAASTFKKRVSNTRAHIDNNIGLKTTS